MSRPTPRRPASSRGSTPRPRKIAGQSDTVRPEEVAEVETADPVEPVEPVEEPTAPSAASAKTVSVDLSAATKPAAPQAPDRAASTPAASAPIDARPGILARPKTTRVLIAVLALVALASTAQFGLLLWGMITDDDKPAVSSDRLSVPEGRPVVADELPVLDGVDQAAKAAQEIVAIDYEAYDAEVDKAAELMTSRFEEQYRATAQDIETEFAANKTKVEANVVAQGVVRASRTRLEALIFLNQVVSRERDGEPETVVTPYKVLVTMVHTDQGWLVDRLDTDLPQDKSN
ncbi:MAG: hypothetical protein NTX33_15390 [Propionibacteriales bacterium]|nr:hypothetical protein [Propionibacteriales bacterium]